MTTEHDTDEVEYEEEDVYDNGIKDTDYGFVLNSDGELTSVFVPVNPPFEIPETVQQILEMFGYNSLDELDDEPKLH